jgi:hypothetical protein
MIDDLELITESVLQGAPATAQQIENQNDDRDDQQNVNVAAQRVGTHQAE